VKNQNHFNPTVVSLYHLSNTKEAVKRNVCLTCVAFFGLRDQKQETQLGRATDFLLSGRASFVPSLSLLHFCNTTSLRDRGRKDNTTRLFSA
jgi:hypothetical protein